MNEHQTIVTQRFSDRSLGRIFPKRCTLLVCLMAFGLILSGCSTSTHISGRPVRIGYFTNEHGEFDKDAYKKFVSEIKFAENSKKYFDDGTSDPQRRVIRDELATKVLITYDENYSRFLEDLSRWRKRIDAGGDITSIALNTAAVLVSPVSTTNILSGLAGAVTTSKIAFNKAYFYEQTLPVLINQMNADRQAVLADILTNLKKDISIYSLTDLTRDLDQYYQAGTLEGALVKIQEAAAEKSQQAQADLDKLVNDRLNEIDLKKLKILAWLNNTTHDQANAILKAWSAGLNPADPKTLIYPDAIWLKLKAANGLRDKAANDLIDPLSYEDAANIGRFDMAKFAPLIDALDSNDAAYKFLAELATISNDIVLPPAGD